MSAGTVRATIKNETDQIMTVAGKTAVPGESVTADVPVIAPKQLRGFALLSPETRKAISRAGGIAAHSVGTAHTWTSDEARAAGSKGGKTTHERRKAKAP